MRKKPSAESVKVLGLGAVTKSHMKITEEQLDSFIALYRDRYGYTLERDDAYDRAIRLLRLITIVESTYYSPAFDDIRQRRENGADMV